MDIANKANTDKTLSPKQEKLLQLYWDSGCSVNPLTLVDEAGYLSNGGYRAVRGLKDEILALTEAKLMLHAPAAASLITEAIVSDLPIPGVKDRLAASFSLLDRLGLGKKDKVEVEHKVSGGLFILPAKDTLSPIEGTYTEEKD